MGQIIGLAAKPKRCNLSQLSQLGTPAAGEHILVSSDNSMNEAGQGNFDCYIVGDNSHLATELPLRRIAEVSASDYMSLKMIVKTIFDSLVEGAWWNGRPIIDFGMYTISGIISDEDNQPIEGATITATVNGITSTAESGADGSYSVSAIAGTCVIRVTAENYDQQSDEIVISGNVTNKNFTLSSGYVSDGLVMYLDGSNRGGVAGEWTDVVNSVKFTLTDCTEHDNHVSFNGSSSKGVNTDNLSTKISLGDYNSSTIEVVLKPNIANMAQCVFLTSVQTVALQINTDSRLLTTSHGQQAKCYNYAWGTSIFSVSASGTRGLANGTSLTSFNNYLTPAVSNCLGYRLKPEGAQQFFNGDIYAVRIYNRVLTYEEVIKNYNIDRQKYNI